jgi:hypothetical protein
VELSCEVTVMPTLELTDDQVVALVRQLPPERRQALLRSLLTDQWETWAGLSQSGQEGARKAAAACGQDWDAMTEEQREILIDDIVHEDRRCRR